MMKIKYFPWVALAAFFLLPLKAFAGGEGRATADPTYYDGGNDQTILSVARSTTAPILISSAPALASLGIRVWRHREIVNTSNGQLMILPNNTAYTAFCGTCGIVLGTGTVAGIGDSYVAPYQGEIWGIWSPLTTSGGAGGGECFWNERKR